MGNENAPIIQEDSQGLRELVPPRVIDTVAERGECVDARGAQLGGGLCLAWRDGRSRRLLVAY